MTADDEREHVRVVVPPEAPTLNPGAARVLLRIVRSAADGLDPPPSQDVDEGRETA